LSFKVKERSDANEAKEAGTDPYSMLLSIASLVNRVSEPQVVGTVPTNELELRSRRESDVAVRKLDGSVPVKWLESSRN
jgi:hypothetical protein